MAILLYQYDECGYCQRVQSAVEELNLRDQIEYRNVRRVPSYRIELLSLTGRTQVPCLVVEGRAMLESATIVAYLRSRFGKR